MTQALGTYKDSVNMEAADAPFMLTNKGGIYIPPESLIPYADNVLLAKYNELNEKYEELEKFNHEILSSSARRNIELDKANDRIIFLEERNRLYEQNSTSSWLNAPRAIYPPTYQNRHKQMPSYEWLANFWENMYHFVLDTKYDGKFMINLADDIVPIYKVMTEDTAMAYKFIGRREDFEYQWNSNIVERMEDSNRSEKLRCKHKSLSAAISRKWKSKPSEWRNLSLDGGKDASRYDKAFQIKTEIKKFAK